MTKETAKIAELLTVIEDYTGIAFNDMPPEEFYKWVKFLRETEIRKTK